jgi:hypothetical protein
MTENGSVLKVVVGWMADRYGRNVGLGEFLTRLKFPHENTDADLLAAELRQKFGCIVTGEQVSACANKEHATIESFASCLGTCIRSV